MGFSADHGAGSLHRAVKSCIFADRVFIRTFANMVHQCT
jgi:hypothetical protein